jgi:hypothetical protein
MTGRASLRQAGARGALLTLLVSAVAACSSAPAPIETLAAAGLAVRKAETSAASSAGAEVRQARAKLDAAEVAMQAKDHETARRLAEEALVDAQVGEARARAQVAHQAVIRMRTGNPDLPDQARPQLVGY